MRKFGVVLADPPWRAKNRGTRASPDHNAKADEGSKRKASSYETMKLDDVCAMPVESVLADDALLALWTPWIFVLDGSASKVATSWGFKVPFNGVPWVKGRWDEPGCDAPIAEAAREYWKVHEDPTREFGDGRLSETKARLYDSLRKDEGVDREKMVLHVGMGNYVRVCSEVLVLARRGNFKVPPALRVRGELGFLAPRGRHSAKPVVARTLLERIAPDVARCELFARDFAPGWSGWGNQTPLADPSLRRVLG